MTKQAKIQKDPNDIEVYSTVAGFEVALRKVERAEGKQYFEVVLRSHDRTAQHQLLLTDKKSLATRQLMAFHTGACAIQHLTGVKLERAA